ncbi:MAG TPA: winged helix-turn-helix domain-containing protein [Microlunatus sp.]|nr:winged helix-turn-helix domain-containing protein [Microlunatus sp.]
MEDDTPAPQRPPATVGSGAPGQGVTAPGAHGDPGHGTAAPEGSASRTSPYRRELLERAERASGQPEREVRLVDAQAIRAVAHEARQRVIDVLYSEQRPYTATQLAELTGLSPSAMSYHLRALERWGVVRRAEVTEDGRSRPWQAAGTIITIAGEGPGAEAAQDVLFATATGALRRRMSSARRLPAEERSRYTGLATGELWLTAEQTERFSLLVERAIVELMETGWVNEPAPGRDRLTFVWSLLPDRPRDQSGQDAAGVSTRED